MNRQQKTTIIVAMSLLFLSIIYVPFSYGGRNLGHHWIFSPTYDQATIDTGKLLVEWAAIAIISFVIYTSFNTLLKALIFAIPALRIIRAAVWLFIIFIAISTISTFFSRESTNMYGEFDMGKLFASLIVKVVIECIFIGVYFFLRNAINQLHIKFYGMPHPSLQKPWSV
ncbi:hypothetical protein ACO0K3_03840 [Undibacterium sp. Rencai35W]|uniref:hypothetical protein n=1 Tax=Undibacterium sp. Rencai35W TaxID=3413046 RepID=UPI003BF307A2